MPERVHLSLSAPSGAVSRNRLSTCRISGALQWRLSEAGLQVLTPYANPAASLRSSMSALD